MHYSTVAPIAVCPDRKRVRQCWRNKWCTEDSSWEVCLVSCQDTLRHFLAVHIHHWRFFYDVFFVLFQDFITLCSVTIYKNKQFIDVNRVIVYSHTCNPFSYTTNLQQTSLKTSKQKYGKYPLILSRIQQIGSTLKTFNPKIMYLSINERSIFG